MARQARAGRGTLVESGSRPAPLEQNRCGALAHPSLPVAALYACRQLPGRWVGTDEHGALVVWPAVAGGWAQQAPYLGHRRALTAADPVLARGTGWPGAGVGRRRLAGAEAGRALTIKIDDTRRAALKALAARQGQSTSRCVLEAIDLAIARGSTR